MEEYIWTARLRCYCVDSLFQVWWKTLKGFENRGNYSIGHENWKREGHCLPGQGKPFIQISIIKLINITDLDDSMKMAQPNRKRQGLWWALPFNFRCPHVMISIWNHQIQTFDTCNEKKISVALYFCDTSISYHQTIVVSILLFIFKHPKFVIWPKIGKEVSGNIKWISE